MRFEQTSDVLDHVGLFHRRVSDLYRQLTEHASSERVRMLLDYMARHEAQLAKSVADYKAESPPQVLASWFKYTHDEDIFEPLQGVDPEADLPFDDVLDLAVELDAQLLELYREMAERAQSPEVKDLFNNLLLREMEEKQKLMHSALGLMDL